MKEINIYHIPSRYQKYAIQGVENRCGMKCRTAAGRRHLMSRSTVVEWKTCELEDEMRVVSQHLALARSLKLMCTSAHILITGV